MGLQAPFASSFLVFFSRHCNYSWPQTNKVEKTKNKTKEFVEYFIQVSIDHRPKFSHFWASSCKAMCCENQAVCLTLLFRQPKHSFRGSRIPLTVRCFTWQ